MLKSNLVNPWCPLRTFLNYPKRNVRSGRCQHQQRGKKHSLMQRISARTKKPRLPSPHYFPKVATMVRRVGRPARTRLKETRNATSEHTLDYSSTNRTVLNVITVWYNAQS